MKKAIITVVGKDTVGILAKVCTFLAANQVNILDISQTVVQDYFNMMMIADTARSSTPFADLVGGLDRQGAWPPSQVPEVRDLREDAPHLRSPCSISAKSSKRTR
jgi:ACT domain-containing protein